MSVSSFASELGKDYVQQVLLKGDQSYYGSPSSTVKCLPRSDPLYKDVCHTVDQRLLHCAHSFHLESVEVVCGKKSCSAFFHSELLKSFSKPYFFFHGTRYRNHNSIFDNGFSLSDEHWGDTDKGYIGKGIYLSPLPEYSAAYIKDAAGVRHYTYNDPVDLGVTCKLLGCIALVGRTRQILNGKEYGKEIESDLESRWAWVKSNGDVTRVESEYFAQEFVIKIPASVYPRFRVSLQRVKKELIWFDSNIANRENSGYMDTLKLQSNISVYATGDSDKALEALKKKKNGIEYRLVTAGHGGEELVRKTRSAGVHCHVLVFCRSVDYHKQWAKKFSNVQVTASQAEFMRFATWK